MKKPTVHSQSILFRFYTFTFFRDLAFFSAVLVPFFTEWGHLPQSTIMVIQSWFMLWIFFLEVPTGVIADKFGRKYSLALGSFIGAIAALVYGTIPELWVFLLGEFLFAVGVALTSGADEAWLYDSLKVLGKEDESKKYFGIAHSIHLVGIFVAAPIGSLIAYYFGVNAPMYLTAIPILISGLVALSMKEPPRITKNNEGAGFLMMGWQGIKYLLQHKQLRVLALDMTLVSSAAYFVIWTYQPLLKNVNTPLYLFGFGHAFLVLCEVIISSNFTKLDRLFGSGKGYLKFSGALTIVMFVVAALLPSIYTVIAFIMLAGGFGLTRQEYMASYLNKFIQSSDRATVNSAISMGKRFMLVILNPIIGFAIDESLYLGLILVALIPIYTVFFSKHLDSLED